MRAPLVILAILACGAAQATTTEVARVKLQEMVAVEVVDSVLDDGELVFTRDESSSGAVYFRLGDGVTPGGNLISDPFALRSPYERLLRRSEYSITPWGNATYSNGVWHLISERNSTANDASNTGGIVIASSAYISRVAGTADYAMAAATSSQALNVRVYERGNSATFAALETSLPPAMGTITNRFAYGISNLQVYAWVGGDLLGTTNDTQGAKLLVADPDTFTSALPLGWWQAEMAGRYAADWSSYGATNTADIGWQDLKHNAFITCVSTGNSGSVSWVRRHNNKPDREILTISTTSTCYRIVAYEAGDTISIKIDSSVPFASAPTIQWSTDFTGGWTNLVTTSAWPTSTWHEVSGVRQWPAFELSTTNPAVATAFFRVSAAAAAQPQETLRTAIPITILPHADTNAPPVGGKLYFEGGKLWAVTAETNRVCLTP